MATRALPIIAALLLLAAPCLADPTQPIVTHVLDTKGHPIAGAVASVTQWESEDPPVVKTTDSEGAFTFPISTQAYQPPVQCVVRARGFAIGGGVISLTGDHTIVLTRTVRVHGIVEDSKGRHIPGALVQADCLTYGDPDSVNEVTLTTQDQVQEFSARTNSHGEYAIAGLPANAYIDVGLTDPRYIDSSQQTRVAGGTLVPPLVAAPGVDIVGRVLTPEGKPAVGVHIQAVNGITGPGWRATVTAVGADGVYHITGLPAGHYDLTVDFSDAQTQKWDAPANYKSDVTAPVGKPTNAGVIRLVKASPGKS